MENHSKDYKKFLYDYFTGPPMIRARGEEDTSVWEKLKGEELENAKQKILDELPSNQVCYMRAASIFRDERAIEKLKQTSVHGDNVHSRAYAAKILFDWIGYDDYFKRLDDVFESDDQWSKTSLGLWIKGLKEEDALKYFWKAMNDKDSFVRFCSYEALEFYYGIRMKRTDGFSIKYFTDEEVYQDKKLFEERQAELKEKIEGWKKSELQ